MPPVPPPPRSAPEIHFVKRANITFTLEVVSYQTHIVAAGGLHHRYYSCSGDVIHPQLRCGSGYETILEELEIGPINTSIMLYSISLLSRSSGI